MGSLRCQTVPCGKTVEVDASLPSTRAPMASRSPTQHPAPVRWWDDGKIVRCALRLRLSNSLRTGGGERGRLRRAGRPDRRESVVHAPPDDGEIGWPRRSTTRGHSVCGGRQQVVQAPNENTLERGRTMSAVPPRPPTSECEAENLHLALANPRNSRTNSPAGSARTFSASRYRSAPACTTSSRSSPSVSTADRIDRVNRGASERFTSNP